MSNVGRWRFMSTIAKSNAKQVLAKLAVIALCALCLQTLCSCASKSGDEGVVDHVIKYATARAHFDMPVSCVVGNTPDAKIDISLMSLEETPSGVKEIKIEPAVTSDTMASWTEDEWAENRDDLYFNLAAHFRLICKQANELGDVPQDYNVTCPDYMVVYDSKKSKGFIVSSTGVYQKTNDSENPIGEAVILT